MSSSQAHRVMTSGTMRSLWRRAWAPKQFGRMAINGKLFRLSPLGLMVGMLCLLFQNAVYAATYYVAMDGNDRNPGTETRPWKSLEKARDSVAAGDTVRIKAGDYFVGPRLRMTRAGTAGNPITYQAHGDGEVRITNSSVLPAGAWKRLRDSIYSTQINPPVLAVFRDGIPLRLPGSRPRIRSVDDLIPDSFYVSGPTLYVWLEDGSDPRNSVMRVSPSHVIELHNSHYNIFNGLTVEYGYTGFKLQSDGTHHITIRNCTMRSISNQGIQPVAKNSVIEHNLFQKIGTDNHQHGIYGAERGTVVRHNIFEEISGAGIHQFRQGGGAGGGCELYGNIFRKPRRMTPGGRYYVDIVVSAGEGGNKIYNNLFYGEGKRAGIRLSTPNNQVYHNTFVDSVPALQFGRGNTGNKISNNIFQMTQGPFLAWPTSSLPQSVDYNLYHHSTSPRWQWNGTTYRRFTEYQAASGEMHSVYADFHPVGATDFRLRSDSPAIDRGTPLAEVQTDFDGVSRPQGCCHDMGAYEFRK
jgi:Periplasmic copper-binding protein (NosD)